MSEILQHEYLYLNFTKTQVYGTLIVIDAVAILQRSLQNLELRKRQQKNPNQG